MNKKTNVVLGLICLSMLVLSLSPPVVAQVSGGGGAIMGVRTGPMDPSRPKIEINREPIPTMDLKVDLVEILPAGVNTIGTIVTSSRGYRVGGNSAGFTTLPGGMRISYKLKIAQLDRDGATIDATISDASKTPILSQRLQLTNYQEALVEVASAEAGNKRLAIRFVPTLTAIPAVLDYPGLVPTLTMSGFLILNSREIVSRNGSVSGSVEDLNGTKQQFFTIGSRNGLLLMSYRPFPGASVAGYFEGKMLQFEWNGDLYEWISMDSPFMPAGKWAAYIWQADTFPNTYVSIGVFEADPNSSDLANKLRPIQQTRKKF
jgi:hypothetical protein